MKRLYLVLILFSFGKAFSQNAKLMTLDDCIQYALQNNVNVQNANLDERIAESKVRETVGIGLPQVNGHVSIDHNQKLRRFFTTYNPTGGFVDLSGVPGIQVGDVAALQNFFQLKSSADAGVNISQMIFNGSYLVGLQASNAYKNYSYKATYKTKAETVEAITKGFYLVLINKELIKLFDNNVARVDSLLRNTKALFANGFAESIDADRVQVQLNNLVTEREKFVNLQQIGIELLKFQMGYPIEEPVDVLGDITKLQGEVNPDDYLKEWSVESRPEYQVLMASKRLQQLNVKNNYAFGMPVLSAHADLGYSTQSANVGGLFKTESKFSDTGTAGPDKWYGYSSFGVNLSVPIFSGLQRTHKIQQERIALGKIENSERMLKSGFDFEIRQSILNYQNSLKSMQSQKLNIGLAENVARVTKIKYKQGVGANLEVVNAEADLRVSQINYYNSLYDLLNAKVNLDKAFGKLVVPDTDKK